MRKFLKLFVILIVSSMLMVACGNNDTSTGSNGDEQDESINDTDQIETDDIDEDSGEADVETDDSDSSDIENDGDVPVLSIGETGVIKNNLGIYEVTPLSFRFEEELSDGDSVRTNFDGRFIIVLIEFRNIGNEVLETVDIIESDLFTETGAGVAGYIEYPSIKVFEDEIPLGGEVVGEIVFDTFERDYYELSFGAHLPSDISNEVRWALHAEDAE